VKRLLFLNLCVLFIICTSAGISYAGGDTFEICNTGVSVEGKATDTLIPGEVCVHVAYSSEINHEIYLASALYSGDLLQKVDMSEKSISAGEGFFIVDSLTADSESTSVKLMVWEKSGLKPLCTPVMVGNATAKPEIRSFDVSIGGYTYPGKINEGQKTIEVDVITEVNQDGTIKAYTNKGPSSDVFNEEIKSLSPVAVLTDGTKIEADELHGDYTNPREITVCGKNGKKASYMVEVRSVTALRGINFALSGISLITPDSSYGSDKLRHGAPNAGGTVYGGGKWKQNGFSYATNSDGSYVKDENGSYTRSDTGTGYVNVVYKTCLDIIKDKHGEYELYSCEGGGYKSFINKTITNTTLAVKNITGTGFDVGFGGSEFTMRISPFEDDRFMVSVGNGEEFEIAPIILNKNHKYSICGVTKKLENGNVLGELFVNGNFVADVEYSPSYATNMSKRHISFKPVSDTLCSVSVYGFDTQYVSDSPSEDALEVYSKLDEELRKIYIWSAGLYDNSSDGSTGRGFFYAPSSRDNPDKFCAEIESTGQMVNRLKNIGIINYMPEDIRESLILFFESRYDLSDGFYYDPMYRSKTNDRAKSRNLDNAQSALKILYALRQTQSASLASCDNSNQASLLSDAEFDYSALPEQYESPEAFRTWIESLAWDTHSWTAGDLLSNAPTYIAKLPENVRDAYWQTAMDFLNERQNENGTFGPRSFGVEISGIFKVCLFLQKVPDKYFSDPDEYLPKSDKVMDYILENIVYSDKGVSSLENILMMRNAMDVYMAVADMGNSLKAEQTASDMITKCFEHMKLFSLGNGEYASTRSLSDGSLTSSAATGMGYNQGMGYEEGCINVCNSIEWIYSMFSKYYRLSRPTLSSEYADKLYGAMRDPKEKYSEITYAEIEGINTADVYIDSKRRNIVVNTDAALPGGIDEKIENVKLTLGVNNDECIVKSGDVMFEGTDSVREATLSLTDGTKLQITDEFAGTFDYTVRFNFSRLMLTFDDGSVSGSTKNGDFLCNIPHANKKFAVTIGANTVTGYEDGLSASVVPGGLDGTSCLLLKKETHSGVGNEDTGFIRFNFNFLPETQVTGDEIEVSYDVKYAFAGQNTVNPFIAGFEVRDSKNLLYRVCGNNSASSWTSGFYIQDTNISGYNITKWHNVRVVLTKTAENTYSAVTYIDNKHISKGDAVFQTSMVTSLSLCTSSRRCIEMYIDNISVNY